MKKFGNKLFQKQFQKIRGKKPPILIIPEELLLELRANDHPSGVMAAE